ncbi:flap endonuclease GEN-like 2 isoform X2 [Ananas comosus]|uniref:Flap endonuclease GEN-like 2 isoform X2 n=1 Tax=Ananas comosus TaxID=4615 RepID=A0A6P5H8M7_ANACO|nr:flap endonuclease GEN-like 2 isoform X2 [Ananas comosus]
MGVKNLWDILESCKKTLPLHHLQNKRLCVDLSCWLIQLRNANRSPACVVKKLYLRGLFHRLRALIALNCSLVLVTDGSIPSIKLSTYRRRLGSGSELNPEEANSQTMTQAVPSLRRNMGSEFSCMIKEAKVLGKALGIPCLDGIEEAEAQCALLNSASFCDGCFTSDSDIFLFGARTVYRDIILEGGYVICYEMVDVERKLGFGRNSLISLAVLLGGDYSNRVYGFGPETACRIVKSIGDDAILQQIMSEGLTIARKNNGKKKPGKLANTDVNKENEICPKQNFCETGNKPVSDGQFLEVINAYLKPKCHSPDSEAVQRVYTEHPFLRLELQRICEQFFGWSPEKTDQYILPKIAERDLRRFANLRSRSSVLGVRIPFSEIPVPCPVSAIVKQRKVQGRECYEVSWQHVDGLDISTIPADLIESACPEKITEFIEKKDEAKKQTRKPRTRKPNKNAVAEVDLQLKGLLLSIESQSNALTDITNRSKPTIVDTVKPIVIDLSSPSPPLHACKVAKCQKTTGQNVDVIEVYESERESEVSSEHARKARELRLFIDSIRHDLR